ncbi:MAG: chemotaxis protein CheA [Chromatiaceae bacterium]|nr:chemotaxis protein CheA [Chromatiaceae bacterium]HPE81366.1 chemotaxis protein CheA [Gammaproteobacteria bacterium]
MSIDMAQFHQVFFEESFEGLDVMESGLLNMDPGTADVEEINAIFRAAHSIKGGSGTFGFMNVSDFTHVMETLLDEMRDGRRQVAADAIEVLLQSVDVLRDMLTAARDGGSADEARVKAQYSELQRVLADKHSSDDAVADPVKQASAVVPEVQPVGWKIVFRPHPHLMRTGNDPLRIIRELATLGETSVNCDLSELPAFEEFEPEDSYLSWDLRLHEPVDKSQIDEIFEWVEDDCDFAVVPVMPEGYDPAAAVEPPAASDQAEPVAQKKPHLTEVPPPEERRVTDERRNEAERRKTPAAAAGGSSSIRVDIHKIDALINMVGELVITQSMLGMLGEDFHISRVERLREGLTQLERHTRELQESVMQIRMVPISFSFSRFPRLVHDLSSKLNKKIELKMSGENTEVDKTVIEKIGDPLVHLVRNSLDHGIEKPEERLAAGKPETGIVRLSASHRGGNIVIEIRDDGRGLPRDKILKKAVERGLVKADDNLSDKDIYDLIFQPGFSTAEQVSDVSGRGVGMDVVRRNINELGGAIEIESTPGKGSAIIIRLPLTLAILDGQTIRIGKETYIVPLVSIVESIQIQESMLNTVVGRGETFTLREEYLPVVRMHEVFGIEDHDAKRLTDGILVVVEGEGRKCGLFVDDLLGQQQVVIKSLEANYRKVEGISGATILGDGSVALILDIPGLMRLAKQGGARTRAPLALTA